MKFLLTSFLLSTGQQVVSGFSVLPHKQSKAAAFRSSFPPSSSSLGLWVDEQGFSTTPPLVTTASNKAIRARIQDCLENNSCDVQVMTSILQELEVMENECTEEGNQTLSMCSLDAKAERQAWMKELEYRISSAAASTMVMMFMSNTGGAGAGAGSNTSSSGSKLEEQGRAYLDGTISMTMGEIANLYEKLEEVFNTCTEEGHQTDEECDVEVKAEREVLMKRLDRKIRSPDMDLVKYTLKNQKDLSLGELTQMMTSLEDQLNLCTEEGNQTNDECDVEVLAQREDLMAIVGERILTAQKETSSRTKLCMQYHLCDTKSLAKTLQNLETINNLCTEEGNQTRSMCSLDAKAERDELIAKLTHELELSQAVVTTPDDRSVFQI